jgi:hypothetical protein
VPPHHSRTGDKTAYIECTKNPSGVKNAGVGNVISAHRLPTTKQNIPTDIPIAKSKESI